MMKRNVNKFTLATLVLAFLVVVPAVAAQIEEGQSVVCRDVNGEIEWIIGIPGESRPVDQFNWGVTGDTPVVLNGQAGVVREVKEGGLKGNLQWIIKKSDGSTERFYWGLKGDTPVVLNGQAGVVREVGSNLKWFIKGSPAFCWGLTAKGDTPVFVPVTGAPVVPSVTAVDEIADISVAFNTTFDKIGLPARVNVTLSNSEVEEVGIDWTAAEGVYSATEVGTQTLEGNLTIPIGITNPGNLTARVNVTVGEAPFIVANVTAVNATHINVTFAEGTGIKEADLEEKVINLSAAAATLNATYVAGSLDGLTTAFALDEGLTLEDARTYDLSADWAAFAEVSFMARIADPTLTKIVKVTTGVPAVPAGQRTVIEFKALDQYGDPIAVNATTMASTTATAKIEGIPLTLNDEYSYTPGYDNVTLLGVPLAEDYNLDVTIKKEDGTVLGALEYIVGAKEDRAAAALELTADKSSMPAQNTATFTVRVTDQFGTTMPVDDGDIRWVVERDGNLAPADIVEMAKNPLDGGATLEITPTEAGTYTVTAAYVDNLKLKQTLTLIVGAAELETIGVTFDGITTVEGINNEPIVSDAVTTNPGAALAPGDLKFNVTAWPESATKDKITLAAAYYQGDAANGINVTVTTAVAGEYKFIAYVGEPYADAVKADEVTVTTVLNDTVASIELEEIGVNELTAGSTITKNLTFLNTYGEKIPVQDGSVTVTKTSRVLVEKVLDAADVTGLEITGTEVGQATIIVESGSARLDVQLSVASAGVITSATLEDLVSEHEVWAAGDAGAYMPVEFIDQYGNTMSLEADDYTVTDYVEVYNATGEVVLAGNFTVGWAKADEAKEGYARYSDAAGNDAIAAVKLTHVGADNGTYTLKIVKDGKALDEKAFVLKPPRELTSITLSPTSASVTRDAKTPVITVRGYDQYDALVDISGMVGSLDVTPEAVTMGDKAIVGKNLTCTLQAATVGAHTAVISLDDVNANFALSVADVGDVIERIEIQGRTASVTPDGEEGYTADLTLYPAKITAGAGINEIVLDVKAFDASNNEVGYDEGSLMWAILGPADSSGFVVDVDSGTITINASGVADERNTTFTVKAVTANNKEDTLLIKISTADPTEQTGTYYLTEDGEGTTRLTTIHLESPDEKSVYIFAEDQYGRPVPVDASGGSLSYSREHAYFTIDATGFPLNLTATEAGTTTLHLRNAVTLVPEYDATVIVAESAVEEPTEEPTEVP